MKRIYRIIFASIFTLLLACDKKDADLVEPLTAAQFPQVIVFDDEGDGGLEDEDEFSFTLTLADRTDPKATELSGTKVPLENDATISFEISETEGINNPLAYIKDVKALYEIDDCTTSEDKGIDLNLAYDKSSGKGSVRLPKGITEIEIIFETDEDLFDDNIINKEERSIIMIITGVNASAENITYNKSASFKYEILDDEAIQGEWEIDHNDPVQFAAFKKLFTIINEDLADLSANDIDKIEFSIEYDEVIINIELKETELVTECGTTERINKTIEIEADIEALDLYSATGEIGFEGEVEQADNSIEEFTYEGKYEIAGKQLKLQLTGEYDGEDTGKVMLILKK